MCSCCPSWDGYEGSSLRIALVLGVRLVHACVCREEADCSRQFGCKSQSSLVIFFLGFVCSAATYMALMVTH